MKPAMSTPVASCPDSSGLHERGSRARERVENAAARRNVALEQRLDELRDELAEIRVQAVNVLRALALGERRLRPRQLEIVLAVERLLGCGHEAFFDALVAVPTRSR